MANTNDKQNIKVSILKLGDFNAKDTKGDLVTILPVQIMIYGNGSFKFNSNCSYPDILIDKCGGLKLSVSQFYPEIINSNFKKQSLYFSPSKYNIEQVKKSIIGAIEMFISTKKNVLGFIYEIPKDKIYTKIFIEFGNFYNQLIHLLTKSNADGILKLLMSTLNEYNKIEKLHKNQVQLAKFSGSLIDKYSHIRNYVKYEKDKVYIKKEGVNGAVFCNISFDTEKKIIILDSPRCNPIKIFDIGYKKQNTVVDFQNNDSPKIVRPENQI